VIEEPQYHKINKNKDIGTKDFKIHDILRVKKLTSSIVNFSITDKS
jgi:hypothetical protein